MEMSEQASQRSARLDPIPVSAHRLSVPGVMPPPHRYARLMRRLLLVANPAASGFTASLHRDVVEILKRGFDVTATWPDGPAQARSEAAAAAAEEFDVIVAMGGDGVAHQVANAIAGTATALGIVPAGTSNVLRKIAGVPGRPRAAAEALTRSTGTRRIPTLTLCEGTNTKRTHVATFAAGVGFDAEVIRESERRPMAKVGFGALHYARSATKVALTSYRERRPTLRVTDGDRSADAVAVLIQVHGRLTFLGRIPLSLGKGPTPIAAVVSRVTTPRLLDVVTRAAIRGGVGGAAGVSVWEGFDRIEVTAEPASLVEADGELLGTAATVVAAPSQRDLLVVT